jgi:dienelactone hydrolase
VYDPRRALPESEQGKVPDREVPVVVAKDPPTYRDLPLDVAHGPYPVVFFVHGTTSFREASYTLTAHWASHGFVVVAADHPGMNLSDFLKASSCNQKTTGAQDVERDVDEEIAALSDPAGDIAFLRGHVDMQRIALSGHSQGAWLTAKMSSKPNVQLVMPLATTTGTSLSPTLKSTFILAGVDDTVIPYALGGMGIANLLSPGSDEAAFAASPGKPQAIKRLVGVKGAGHLLMTDLCRTNADGKNSIQLAQQYGVCGITIQPAIFDCNKIDVDRGLTIVGDATTAALEETLHCQDRAQRIKDLPKRYPEVTDYREQ